MNNLSWRDIEYGFDWYNCLEFLMTLIPNDGKGVELGTCLAKSTCALSELFVKTGKNYILYTIDNYSGNHTDIGKNMPHVAKSNIDNLCQTRVAQVIADSSKAASLFDNNSLDFVLIDADHSYEGCKKDILAWVPKLKKGGVICGDDYTAEGVRNAVSQIIPNHLSMRSNNESLSFWYKII